jgi:AraC-like DNA-binding protein
MTVAQRTRVGHEAIVLPGGGGRKSRAPSAQPRSSLELGMVRLPGRMRRALGLFRSTTGLTAVAAVVAPLGESEAAPPLSPPVHPRCAKRLRSGRTAPCRKQWFIHVRSSRRSPSAHSHICPIGLRCSCVPIQFDGRLIGVAKLVVGSETSDRRFSSATSVLKLIVNGVCQDSLASRLSEEVGALRQRLVEMRQVQSTGVLGADRSAWPVAAPDSSAAQRQNRSLVESALWHLHRHYQSPALTLPAVAEALACNPRYLTTRFTLMVGEHMHAYLVRLRVAHACRLLMDTDVPVKAAAFASGFRDNAGLARAFRRLVGVSPGEYRRIFAAR